MPLSVFSSYSLLVFQSIYLSLSLFNSISVCRILILFIFIYHRLYNSLSISACKFPSISISLCFFFLFTSVCLYHLFITIYLSLLRDLYFNPFISFSLPFHLSLLTSFYCNLLRDLYLTHYYMNILWDKKKGWETN